MTITNQYIKRLCNLDDDAIEYAAHVTTDLHRQLAEKDAEIARLHSALTAAEERAAETLALLNAEIANHQWQPLGGFPEYGTRALGLVNGRAVEVEFQYYSGWVELYGEGSAVDPSHIAPLPEAPRTEDGE